MTLLSLEQARAFGAWNESRLPGLTIIHPDEAGWLKQAADVVDGIAALVPGGRASTAPYTRTVSRLVEEATANVSVTLPTPFGVAISISRAAMRDGPALFATLMHELVHFGQVKKVGVWQSAVDYLGSGELRAHREAEACGVALWSKFVLTGEADIEEASILRSALYHLDDVDRAFARGVLRASGIEDLRAGARPAHALVADALHWLEREVPEAIVADPYRLPATVVPT